MKIYSLLKTAQTLSFEVFPPKRDAPVSAIDEPLRLLSELSPDFISVTYGAGGKNREGTARIAAEVQNTHGATALFHLTCAGADREGIRTQLSELRRLGIENILALRGDVPKGLTAEDAFREFRHATDLLELIRDYGGFCAGAAAYPEVHPESTGEDDEFLYMLKKQEAGADFFITQLCFDTDRLRWFMDEAGARGIVVPILAGIMPVTDSKQILRMTGMCGCSIPRGLSRLFARYEGRDEELERAGIDYATEQVTALLKAGAAGVHIYSMNKPEPTRRIVTAAGLRQAAAFPV